MKKRRWRTGFIAIGLAVLLLNAAALAFNDTQESRATLREVTLLYAVIEGITPVLEQKGVNAKQLKIDVESQLKDAGIQLVSTVKEKKSAESFPAGLYVRINALKSAMLKSEFDIDFYALSIRVELIQRFLPLAKKNIDPACMSSHSALACTWSTSNIYLAGEERITAIRDCVKDLVGHFIKAYLSVNPKR